MWNHIRQQWFEFVSFHVICMCTYFYSLSHTHKHNYKWRQFNSGHAFLSLCPTRTWFFLLVPKAVANLESQTLIFLSFLWIDGCDDPAAGLTPSSYRLLPLCGKTNKSQTRLFPGLSDLSRDAANRSQGDVLSLFTTVAHSCARFQVVLKLHLSSPPRYPGVGPPRVYRA